jgi:dihydrofolate reductase
MRRIAMFNLATADGYFAGPDGGLDFFVPDKDFDRAAARNTQGFDTVLLGRVTYKREKGKEHDRFRQRINPVLLGSGKSLLGSTRGAGLELLESRTYRSGNVFLRYGLRASEGAATGR